MGLFSKIKNVLFEEEEIEIPVFIKVETKEEVVQSKPARTYERYEKSKLEEKPKPKEVKKEPEVVVEDNEREIFKTEPTFQFPVFDESEFEETKKSRVSTKNVESKKKNLRKIDFGKYENLKKEEPEKKHFTPSPVISPVYGVLDKNYTKKDVVVKSHPAKEKVVDIDSIRNKAYGTLEEEIEKTFKKPVEEFYETKPTKSIDDLLIDSVDEEIPVDDVALETEDKNVKNNSLDLLDEIEEDIKENKQSNDLDDTLESDLFNLIDSMYTNKEEDN